MIVIRRRYEFEPLQLKAEFPPLNYRRRNFTTYRLINYKTLIR